MEDKYFSVQNFIFYEKDEDKKVLLETDTFFDIMISTYINQEELKQLIEFLTNQLEK